MVSSKTMREGDAQLVRQLPLFRSIAAESFDTLMVAGYLQRFPAGVTLLNEGQRPDFLHVLVEGRIDLFSSHRGNETTLTVLAPPAAFILAAVIVDGVYLKSARTLSPSTILLIPAADVRSVFARDHEFARATVVELACRYRALVKDLKNQRLRTGLERLGNWVLTQDAATGGTGTFRIPIEKRALANQLGMRPENLSRAFAELDRIGVTVDGPMVRIRDRAALIAACKPNPLIDDPTT